MRRSLVPGDERAHHPFLQSLPPHVRGESRVAGRAPVVSEKDAAKSGPVAGNNHSLTRRHAHALRHAIPNRAARLWAGRKVITAADVRGFLLAYCACFMAVMAFIV